MGAYRSNRSVMAWIGLAVTPALALEPAVSVSPGSQTGQAELAPGCPVFSWSALPGADSYELIVVQVGDTAASPDGSAVPALREKIAGGATSWAPGLERCLAPGSTYAWFVRAFDAEGSGEWSAPRLFEVGAAPSATQVREALDVLRRWLETEPSERAALEGSPLDPDLGPESVAASTGAQPRAPIRGVGGASTPPRAGPLSAEAALFAQASADTFSDQIYDLELGGQGEIFSEGPLALISNASVWVDLDEDNESVVNSFIVWSGSDQKACEISETGSLICSGAKSAVVETASHGRRRLYAVEATQNWFEDIGTAELVAGEATVTIDRIFAETVNLEVYQVFLTPVGAEIALSVAEQSPTAFRVRARDAPDRLRFHWRLIAPRLGYEHLRLDSPDESWPVRPDLEGASGSGSLR